LAGQNKGKKENTFHTHSLGVTGFLGGITFAAMILLIQSRNDIQLPSDFPPFYLDSLITGTAISSVLFIVASVGMIRVAAGEKDEDDPFSHAMATFASLGFFGLMALLPLLVWPFLLVGAIIVAIVEAIAIGIFLHYLLRRNVKA